LSFIWVYLGPIDEETYLMTYSPHTEDDRQALLRAIGVESIDALFAAVPETVRFPNLDLPPALSPMEVGWEMAGLAGQNAHIGPAGPLTSFLGAGAYDHYVPSLVDHVLRRGEFFTAYTPYQPEVSQGTLQAIFEYQTMMAELTGMDVSNASHYDGATAVAEAVLMAANIHPRRKRIVMSPTVHPHYRQVVQGYVQGTNLEVVGDDRPAAELEETLSYLDQNCALVIVQSPNFFGQFEPLAGLAERVHAAGALLCVVAEPIHMGLFKPPGDYGADIVCGEGQPLGLPLSYGGPYLGYFCSRNQHVRKMAGRLVGETIDADGRRSYVLALATREQHIRRGKATSNICTNQGLMALAAAVYLATLGKQGLRRVAELCYHNAHYLAGQVDALDDYQVWQGKPFFKEFVVVCPQMAADVNQRLLDEYGIIGGYDLGRDYLHLSRHLLVCATETTRRADMDRLVQALAEIAANP
jgi:glycine dehydrogenase subunit 1